MPSARPRAVKTGMPETLGMPQGSTVEPRELTAGRTSPTRQLARVEWFTPFPAPPLPQLTSKSVMEEEIWIHGPPLGHVASASVSSRGSHGCAQPCGDWSRLSEIGSIPTRTRNPETRVAPKAFSDSNSDKRRPSCTLGVCLWNRLMLDQCRGLCTFSWSGTSLDVPHPLPRLTSKSVTEEGCKRVGVHSHSGCPLARIGSYVGKTVNGSGMQ